MKPEQTAIHEAGHAVVGYVLGFACNEMALTPEDVEETGAYGYVRSPHPLYGYHRSGSSREDPAKLRDQSIEHCAGLAAEHVFFQVPLNTDNENARSDFQNVLDRERDGMRIPGKRGGFVGDEGTWDYIQRR